MYLLYMHIENILNMCSWAKQNEKMRLLRQGKITRRSYREYKRKENSKYETHKWNQFFGNEPNI